MLRKDAMKKKNHVERKTIKNYNKLGKNAHTINTDSKKKQCKQVVGRCR